MDSLLEYIDAVQSALRTVVEEIEQLEHRIEALEQTTEDRVLN